MSQVYAWQLPETFVPSGIAVSCSDEALTLWSTESRVLIRLSMRTRRMDQVLLPHDLTPRYVAPLGDGAYEIISAVPHSLFLFESDGTVPHSLNLTTDALLDARHGSEGWEVLTRASDRGGTIRTLDGTELHRTPHTGWLRRYGSLTIVSQPEPPFRITTFNPSTGTGSTFRPFAEMLATAMGRPDSQALQGLVALPALALDHGFLQTLSDVRSNTRVIVVYSEDGSVLSHQTLDVPMAFVESMPERRLAWAVRRTNVLEVLEYRWERRRAFHIADEEAPDDEHLLCPK